MRCAPVLLAVLAVLAWASTAAGARAGTLVIEDPGTRTSLLAAATVIRDAPLEWTGETLVKLMDSPEFAKLELQASGRAVLGRRLIRLDLLNETANEDWAICLDNPDLDLIEVVVLGVGGNASTVWRTGITTNPKDRPLGGFGFSLPVKLPRAQSVRVAVLIDDALPSVMDLRPLADVRRTALLQESVVTIGLGIFLAALVLGVVQFLRFGQWSSVWLSVFALSQIGFWTFYFQVAWFAFGLQDTANRMSIFFVTAVVISGSCHAVTFLNLRRSSRSLLRMYQIFLLVTLPGCLVSFMVKESIALTVVTLSVLFLALASAFAGCMAWLHGARWARLYAMAWATVILAIVFRVGTLLSLPFGEIVAGTVLFGCSSVAFLMLALAERDKGRLLAGRAAAPGGAGKGA